MEKEKFIEEFSRLMLFSVCDDFHKMFLLKKGNNSKISKQFYLLELHELVETIADSLIRNGKYYLYYKYDNYNINFTFNKNNNDGKIKFILPKSIIPKRRKILKTLASINSNKLFSDNTNKISNLKYINEMNYEAAIRINSITKDIYYSTFYNDYFNSFYNLYRQIKMNIKQRQIIDYILGVLNDNFKTIFKLDEDDIIEFKGKTIDFFNNCLDDLLNNRSSIREISEKLYNT